MNTKRRSAVRFLQHRMALMAVLIALGAVAIGSAVANGISAAAADLQAELLLNSIKAGVRYDLLSGNLVMTSERINSLISGPLSQRICVNVLNGEASTVLMAGRTELCLDGADGTMTDKIFFDEESKNEAYELKVSYLKQGPDFGFPVYVWLIALTVVALALGLVLSVTRTIHTVFEAMNGLLASEPAAAGPVSKSKRMISSLEEVARIRQLVAERNASNKQLIESEVERKEVELKAQIQEQVAHDILSPLSALEYVQKNLKASDESLAKLLDTSINRVKEIAGDLKRDSDQTKPSPGGAPKYESIAPAIDGILLERRALLPADGRIRLNLVHIPDAGSCIALHDEAELKRVLSNLINNSVEAIGPDGAGEVQVAVSSDKDWVQIAIRDNGPGIEKAVLERLGERGQSHNKANGSGLGLYHAKSTVSAWGGHMQIESAVGVGTTVSLSMRAEAPV